MRHVAPFPFRISCFPLTPVIHIALSDSLFVLNEILTVFEAHLELRSAAVGRLLVLIIEGSNMSPGILGSGKAWKTALILSDLQLTSVWILLQSLKLTTGFLSSNFMHACTSYFADVLPILFISFRTF